MWGSKVGSVMAVCAAALTTLITIAGVGAEDPYRFFDWIVTYGVAAPLGVPQKVILINGQFPGPEIACVTNDNLVINVHNRLDEPFLLSWNGLQHRKNSYVDGVAGTTCPIPPGRNYTYKMQVKDQIGSFFYFPSLAYQKAAGGYGGIRINSRPAIPVPFPTPDGDFTVLIGDWYRRSHSSLRNQLDRGRRLPLTDGVLINGKGSNSATFNVEKGKTYRLRISNVGLQNTLNFRIQGHTMKLVEVEGTHTVQTTFSWLDIHAGQSCSVLVTADQPSGDFHIAVSTRFTTRVLTATATLHYQGSRRGPAGPPPAGPTTEIEPSFAQARAMRTNLTASGPRPNPQGSYRYGEVSVTRTVRVASAAAQVGGKQRYGVNGVSFAAGATPLKLADYFNISGVFRAGSMADSPSDGGMYVETAVMDVEHRAFMEIVVENREGIPQSWHLDGHSFFVVGMEGGEWRASSRKGYNLKDAVSRSTVQVYPRSWTAVYLAADNVGMWNMRSEFWARQYLGQQFYMRVHTPARSPRDEYDLPANALLCGEASGRRA